MWKYINSKKGTSRIPGKLIQNGLEYDDPQDIVNAFATKFSDTFIAKPDFEITNINTYAEATA
mgnify:FL=1